ncbi:Hypothetical protein CINCED_3A018785 [Cinara cedri]|uniref:Uncharacterized protein n=1 Tax=Cinara cedri TaxID=506608 RepID=A0A5E4MTY4_9HEMI|nr:Hypothetical protein CINCED_3A018785 [Cinara cedri]
MTNCFKTMIAVAMVVGVTLSVPVPDDKPELSNEIIQSGGFSTKNDDSVSASWGGFQASASLADDGSVAASAGGNGVGAGAGYGTGGATAGAAIGVPSDSGSSGTKPNNYARPGTNQHGGAGNGFFDRIFAIPINVLQSVNTYLNQKQVAGQQGGPAHQNGNGGGSASTSSSASSSASYGGSGKDATVGADYGHTASAGQSGSPNPMMIPITALRSVQNLLNG